MEIIPDINPFTLVASLMLDTLEDFLYRVRNNNVIFLVESRGA